MNRDAQLPNIWIMRRVSDGRQDLDGKRLGLSIRKTCRASADSLYGGVHWHDFVHIWYTVDGEYDHMVYGRKNRLTKGTLIVIPPFTPHQVSGEPGQHVTTACCDITIDVLRRILPREKQRFFLDSLLYCRQEQPYLVIRDCDEEKLDLFFERIHLEYTRNPQRFCIVHLEHIREFLDFIIYRADLQANEDKLFAGDTKWQLIMRVTDWIEAHYAEPIQLQDMCRLTTLSRAAFCKLFKQYTGNTFSQYLLSVRIQHAGSALVETKKPIRQIIAESGIPTKSNFNRYFKEIFGCTPREYRYKYENWYSETEQYHVSQIAAFEAEARAVDLDILNRG